MVDLRVVPPTSTAAAEVQVMGKQIVNGRVVASTRPLEFVTALALRGGDATIAVLRAGLFGGCASKSAIANLAYRARGLGIETTFDRYRDSYRLATPVTIDVIELMLALREGDHGLAMWLYEGPYLPASRSPMSARLRELLARRVREAHPHVDPALRDRYRARFAELLGDDTDTLLDEYIC